MIREVAVRIAEVHAVREERGAESAPRVARRRRDEDALEAALAEDARVADPVPVSYTHLDVYKRQMRAHVL